MKKYLNILLALGFIVPTLAYASAAAEGTSGTSTTGNHDASSSQPISASTPTQATPNSSGGTSKTAETTDDSQGLAERLAEHKAQQKTKLNDNDSKHIKSVCKAAQGKATSTNSKVNGLATSRSQVYANITSKLNELVAKLQSKGVDVSQLQAEITTLQNDIATFNTDMSTYKQDVSDVIKVDCASDPTAFQASLDAARAAREKVAQDSSTIKTYVQDTIKPTLEKIREQLSKGDGTSAATSSDTKSTTTNDSSKGSN